MRKIGNPEPLPTRTLEGESATHYLKVNKIWLGPNAPRIKGVLPPAGFVLPQERATLDAWKIQELSGIGFEHWCAKRLSEQGWTAILTARSGDAGTDIIAVSPNRRIAVSCKHSSIGNKVVSRWIRDLRGSAVEWLCQEMLIITNTELTKPALQSSEIREITCHVINQERLLQPWFLPRQKPLS